MFLIFAVKLSYTSIPINIEVFQAYNALSYLFFVYLLVFPWLFGTSTTGCLKWLWISRVVVQCLLFSSPFLGALNEYEIDVPRELVVAVSKFRVAVANLDHIV